jgi:arylsulfatase A-like enzyme
MVEWVAGLSDAPFFLFLHTYEAHEPYTHTGFAASLPSGRLSGEYSKKLDNQMGNSLTDDEKRYAEALYDGDIAYTDAHLGRLFRDLEKRGWLENTVVIVTSDHGEQLWDHGSWGHGQSLHDHQIRVPLIVHLPPAMNLATGRVETDQVELIDLYPTVLELAGVPLQHEVQGRSLLPLLAGEGPLPPRQAFAEGTNIRAHEKRALRTPRFKFVLWEKRKANGEDEGRYELFDLRADPREQHDLFGRHPEQAARLKAEIERRVRGADAVRDEEVPAGVDEELRKQLEALGYIGN